MKVCNAKQLPDLVGINCACCRTAAANIGIASSRVVMHGTSRSKGGEAYLKDLPKAEMHRLEAGHFAVEDNLDYISKEMHRFYKEKVAGR